MWLKGLENNKKKNDMFLDFGFEALKKEKNKEQKNLICNRERQRVVVE